MVKLELLSVLMLSRYLELGNGVRSGPYKASYVRAEDCSKPALPIDEHPPASITTELHNVGAAPGVKMLAGRVLIHREFTPKKVKSTGFVWHNNKWKVNNIINNFHCKRVFFPFIAKVTGLRYNQSTCTFYKGDYRFSNLNVNSTMHVVMKSQEYGRAMWRSQVFSQAGTMYCGETEMVIEPI